MALLQAHSPLWHYLWVAPNVLLLLLAGMLLRRGSYGQYPAFLVFTIVGGSAELVAYSADLAPGVTAEAWWRLLIMALLIEALLKFAVLGEIFNRTFHVYESLVRVAKIAVRILGALLLFAAAIAAAYAPPDGRFGIIARAHLLQQTTYVVETGMLLFVFAFAAYFHIRLKRCFFGIALGLSISSCVHLAVWALIANGGLSNPVRERLEFLNMGAYHVAVLVWIYYLLVPPTIEQGGKPLRPPDGNVSGWNRELERLIKQ